VEVLLYAHSGESVKALSTLVRDFVTELTGKQTIYQMFRLAEELEKRGMKPEAPLSYKHEYNRRLLLRIENRRESLRNGLVDPADMMVPFTSDMLLSLRDRGVALYLASGTDEEYVFEEARLLGIDSYFSGHIYGALDDYKRFSKKMVIDRILSLNAIDGGKLVVFGDGYVEIENGKSVGGTTVAVASDEALRNGKCDEWKRSRLIKAGADIVIPDYHDYGQLLEYLWNGVKSSA